MLGPDRLLVSEVFDTVQGEGVWTGMVCTFIRLQVCGLRCPFCDTKHTWTLGSGDYTECAVEAVAARVRRPAAVITGGEPLLHDLSRLFALLLGAGKRVHVETSGSAPWLPAYSEQVWVCCSPKEDSRRLRGWQTYDIHPSLRGRVNELKYVVTDAFTPADVREEWLAPGGVVCLQPESCRPDMVEKALGILDKRPEWRLSLQTHKWIGVR